MAMTLNAPFPYFGGKRRVAAEVWRRFGDVRSYVEPFFGSGAVLLGRPQPFSGVETVNDLDGLLCNFWRATRADPAAVARFADWPVSECDLTARHLWLVERREGITERLCADPDWYDAQAAGWWVWGACSWIGSGWCAGDGPWSRADDALVIFNTGRGINRQLPHLGNTGRGIINRQLPHLGDGSSTVMVEWMAALSNRIRSVRITCGPWERVTSNTVVFRGTGHWTEASVFLDPPYDTGLMDYGAGGMGKGIAQDVREWALDAGRRSDLRIAVCGYDEHDALADAGWSAYRWKAAGGYGGGMGSAAAENAAREVIWFSPACLGTRQPSLFDEVGA